MNSLCTEEEGGKCKGEMVAGAGLVCRYHIVTLSHSHTVTQYLVVWSYSHKCKGGWFLGMDLSADITQSHFRTAEGCFRFVGLFYKSDKIFSQTNYAAQKSLRANWIYKTVPFFMSETTQSWCIMCKTSLTTNWRILQLDSFPSSLPTQVCKIL